MSDNKTIQKKKSSFSAPQLRNLAGTPSDWIHKAPNSDRVPRSLKFLNSWITGIPKFMNYLDPFQVNPFFIFLVLDIQPLRIRNHSEFFPMLSTPSFFHWDKHFCLLSSAVNGLYLSIFSYLKKYVLTSMISPKFWINYWQLCKLDIL